jgi:small subunit ribosomal protein S20
VPSKERKGRKSHRQSLKRYERNKAVRSETRTAVKKAAAAIAGSPKAPETEAAFRSAASAVDVAARKGVIHKKTAARKKARLAKRLNKAGAAA